MYICIYVYIYIIPVVEQSMGALALHLYTPASAAFVSIRQHTSAYVSILTYAGRAEHGGARTPPATPPPPSLNIVA